MVGSVYLNRQIISTSLGQSFGATLRLSGYPVYMSVWKCEKRRAKSAAI
jgi:hypothetical protein